MKFVDKGYNWKKYIMWVNKGSEKEVACLPSHIDSPSVCVSNLEYLQKQGKQKENMWNIIQGRKRVKSGSLATQHKLELIEKSESVLRNYFYHVGLWVGQWDTFSNDD